jgi:hypothetical protein
LTKKCQIGSISGRLLKLTGLLDPELRITNPRNRIQKKYLRIHYNGSNQQILRKDGLYIKLLLTKRIWHFVTNIFFQRNEKCENLDLDLGDYEMDRKGCRTGGRLSYLLLLYGLSCWSRLSWKIPFPPPRPQNAFVWTCARAKIFLEISVADP